MALDKANLIYKANLYLKEKARLLTNWSVFPVTLLCANPHLARSGNYQWNDEGGRLTKFRKEPY
jgi:hypothetical protein